MSETMNNGQDQTKNNNVVPVLANAEVVGGEPHMNKKEVAARLRKTVRTIDNWMSGGRLPYYKIGRSVTFKWSEVEEHLGKTCRICQINYKR